MLPALEGVQGFKAPDEAFTLDGKDLPQLRDCRQLHRGGRERVVYYFRR